MILFTFSLLTSLTSVLLNSLIIIATYLKTDYKAGVGESGSHSDFLVLLPYFGVAVTIVYELKRYNLGSYLRWPNYDFTFKK